MSTIKVNENRLASLVSYDTLISVPFVRVEIGGYSFGVYEKDKNKQIKYPNFIENLTVKKTNGAVNEYKLSIKYPITPNCDPNFFDKLLSTQSAERKISIHYGDFMQPNYIFRDESAIITTVTNNYVFEAAGPIITYTINAVSATAYSLTGSYTFPARSNVKPSDVIMDVLYNTKYGLTDIFSGMKRRDKVLSNGWIAVNDKVVSNIPTYTNISALDYIYKLVSNMTPTGSDGTALIKSGSFVMSIHDSDDGAYFKITQFKNSITGYNNGLISYCLDIGYPTSNIITSFRVNDNANWSLYYNYNKSLGNADYIERVDNSGNLVKQPAWMLYGMKYEMKDTDSTWWTNVTQYPVNATLTLNGLLKPAMLMTYVQINVWLNNQKHLMSGIYAITSQTDSISTAGYKTTLGLVRIASDMEVTYDDISSANLIDALDAGYNV